MFKTGLKRDANTTVMLHKTGPQVAQELHACIGCNECLHACPAVTESVAIDVLNSETLSGPISAPVAQFARASYQMGACVAPSPLVLHLHTIIMSLNARLPRSGC